LGQPQSQTRSAVGYLAHSPMRASLEANDFRTSQHERRGLVLRKVAIEHRWVRLPRGFLGGGSLHRGDMHPPFLPFPIGPLSQRLLRFLFPRNSLSRFTAARSSEATPFESLLGRVEPPWLLFS